MEEYLNYDVAREFIKTGNRIEPKKYSYSWNLDDHSSKFFKIKGFIFRCDHRGPINHPDVFGPRTTVLLYGNPYNDGVSLELAYLIYKRFRYSKKRPIFEFDGEESYNPSLLSFLYDSIEMTKIEIIKVLSNHNASYFFPAQISDELSVEFDTVFSANTFIKNLKKSSSCLNLKINRIRICTMEQLEFVLNLLNSEENQNIS